MSRRAIFIPTYNRPNNIITYETLKKQNYNGDIYFIVGDDVVEYSSDNEKPK